MKYALVLFALIALPLDAPASWGGGSCGPVGPSFGGFAQPMFLAAPELEWITFKSRAARFAYLYQGRNPIGRWDHLSRIYQPVVGDDYGEAEPCPITPPAMPAGLVRDQGPVKPPVVTPDTIKADLDKRIDEIAKMVKKVSPAGEVPNFGVLTEELGYGPKYSDAKHAVTKEEAYKAVQTGKTPSEAPDGKLIDDSNKLTLTIAGDAAECKRVLDDIPATLKGKVKTWCVPTGHFSLKDSATGKPMYPDGKPMVCLQAPDGTVLYRESEYRLGDMEAIRKAHDDYDPRKDPGRRPAGGGNPIAGIQNVPPLLWGLGAVALCLGFMAYRKDK